MPRIVIAALLAALAAAALADELTAAKHADIRKLMDVTGSSSIASQFAAAVSQSTFRALKQARPAG